MRGRPRLVPGVGQGGRRDGARHRREHPGRRQALARRGGRLVIPGTSPWRCRGPTRATSGSSRSPTTSTSKFRRRTGRQEDGGFVIRAWLIPRPLATLVVDNPAVDLDHRADLRKQLVGNIINPSDTLRAIMVVRSLHGSGQSASQLVDYVHASPEGKPYPLSCREPC